MSVVFRVLFQGDTTNLDAAFRKATNTANKFGNDLANSVAGRFAGLFSAEKLVGGIEDIIAETVRYVTGIKDASEQTRLTTEEVQRLTIAAQSVGLTFEDVSLALSNLGKIRKEAALDPDGEAADKLKKYGVAMEQIQDPMKTNLDLLKQISSAVEDAPLNSAQLEEFRELFGRKGDRLSAVFEELKKAKEQPIISDEDVKKIDEASKKIERIKGQIKVAIASSDYVEHPLLTTLLGPKLASGIQLSQEIVKQIKRALGIGIANQGYDSPIGPPLPPGSKGPLYPGVIRKPSSAEQEAFKDMLEIFDKVADFNKIARRTNPRTDRLLDIRRLIGAASDIGTDGIVNAAQSGKLRLDAIAKIRGLREDLAGPLHIDVNSAQAVGAKISNFRGQDENNRLLKQLLYVEKQLVYALQKTTGQVQNLDQYQ